MAPIIPYIYEIGSAIGAALCVSPLVAIVDKAIFSNASGKATLPQSFADGFKVPFLKHLHIQTLPRTYHKINIMMMMMMMMMMKIMKMLFLKPHHFFRDKSFLWIWFVYSGTYIAKNGTEQFMARRQPDAALPEWMNTPAVPVFAASTVTNISLSLMKDRAFSRYYGVTAPKPVPLASSLCYAVRDMITIGASFTAVTPIAKKMQDHFNLTFKKADTVAQLTVPIVAQLFNTPIFILGMDIYNNPQNNTQQKVGAIKRLYVGTFLSRCGRIFPAFGIGGVLNKELRARSQEIANAPGAK